MEDNKIDINKDNIIKWFLENFRTHTDWTGSYVEFNDHANSVHKIANKFINDFGIKTNINISEGINDATIAKFKVGDVVQYWDDNSERAYDFGPIDKIVIDDEFGDVFYIDKNGYRRAEDDIISFPIK